MTRAPIEETAKWTADELKRFDALTMLLSSPRQMARINARIDVKKFEAEHGAAKCQAMFDHLMARDAKRKAKRS